MKHTTIPELQDRLREHLADVAQTKEPLHVEDDADAVVILDLETFAELARLAEEAEREREAEALLESYASAMAGNTRPASEFFAERTRRTSG